MSDDTVDVAFGPFEVDEARFELRKHGEVVPLQPKVMELILYLIRHRARVVPKAELFDEVWEGAVVTEASLSQAASLARRALDDSPKDQHTIRTVRRKGLQFVADVTVTAPPAMKLATPPPRIGATVEETLAENEASTSDDEIPHLAAILHGDLPAQGGACWSLDGIDEVQLMRGSARRFEIADDVSRVLSIALPGRLLSRRHARLVRTKRGWTLVDDGSRNGTTVDGVRIDKQPLEPGMTIGCGRNLLRFGVANGSAARDTVLSGDNLLSTVSRSLAPLARDLERIATSELPVLLLGETGVGKSLIAERLHARSGRRGRLERVKATTVRADPEQQAALLGRAKDGTLVIEGVEAIDPEVAPVLASLLDDGPQRRLICTSRAPFEELRERVPGELLTRLAGFRCTLPPLRERIVDLGVLVATWLPQLGPVQSLAPEVSRALVAHDWPGNHRELFHCLEAASRLAEDGHVQLEHLPEGLR